jgi:hypothetical protein
MPFLRASGRFISVPVWMGRPVIPPVGFGGPSAAPPVAEPRARTSAHSAVKGSLIDRVDDVVVRAICVMSMSARSAAGTRRWLE